MQWSSRYERVCCITLRLQNVKIGLTCQLRLRIETLQDASQLTHMYVTARKDAIEILKFSRFPGRSFVPFFRAISH